MVSFYADQKKPETIYMYTYMLYTVYTFHMYIDVHLYTHMNYNTENTGGLLIAWQFGGIYLMD